MSRLPRRAGRIVAHGIAVVATLAAMVAPLAIFATPAQAAVAANIDQCVNGGVSPLTLKPCRIDGTFKDWVNGNSNGQKSHWSEDEFISYRVTVTGLTPGPHSLVFHYDVIHGGKHALDYIGSFDATETTVHTSDAFHYNFNNPCLDKLPNSQCGDPPTAAATRVVPAATLANCGGSQGTPPAQEAGSFNLFGPAGSTLTGATYVSQNTPSGQGQCSTTMELDWNLAAGGSTVVLAWGGHIAAEASAPIGWGAGNSATFINGSPYHMALDKVDGFSTGSQDRALSTTAVVFVPTMATVICLAPDTGTCTPAGSSVAIGTTVYDTAALTGASSAAGGTVTYKRFNNGDCSGTPASTQNVTVTNAIVPDSSTFTPLGAGSISYQAVYSGDAHDLGTTSPCEPLAVGKAQPTLTTTPQPASGTVGDTLNDKATLAGGVNLDGTGSITVTLFGPSDQTCSGAGVYSQTFTAISANGDYTTSPGFTTLVAGTYHWTASFTGDGNNKSASSACADEAVVIEAPPVVSQITPTATTCDQFKNGTADTLSQIQYAVRSGVISQVNPGVFFYWVKVTTSGGPTSFTIDQSITTGNFSTFFTLASGSFAYNSNCVKVNAQIAQSNGDVTVSFNQPAGTYFIGIKYSTSAAVGQNAPSPGTTVHYTFETTGVAGSLQGLDLVKKV